MRALPAAAVGERRTRLPGRHRRGVAADDRGAAGRVRGRRPGPGGERRSRPAPASTSPTRRSSPTRTPALRGCARSARSCGTSRPGCCWPPPTRRSAQVLRHRRLGRIWRDREPAETYEPFNTAAPQPDDGERAAGAHPAAAAGRRRRSPAGTSSGCGRGSRRSPTSCSTPGRGGRRPVDLVAGYAEPLPVAVIAELLGVPARRPRRAAGLVAGDRADVRVRPQRRGRAGGAAGQRASSRRTCAALVATRRERPRRRPADRPDARARRATTAVSEDELVASVVLLLNAGHEASVNAFGNGVVALLRHRDQLARLTSGDVPAPVAVEELLRHDAAAAAVRAHRDRRRRGRRRPGRGGREGRRAARARRTGTLRCSTEPDRFDVGRDPNPHVGLRRGRALLPRRAAGADGAGRSPSTGC